MPNTAIPFACGLVCVTMLLASGVSAQDTPETKMIAINVLIEPDAAMIERAKRVNARLRQNYAQGYAFDANHAPHITLVQRFVRASDIAEVAAAVADALRPGPSLPIKLVATGYNASESSGAGVVICEMERSPEVLALAEKVEAAVRPFAVSGGTVDAFAKAPGEEIRASTVRYVETFVPASSGENYLPHLTLGTAQPDFAKTLAAAPFSRFTFNGVDIAIYQLGNFGTAQKKLWALKQR